MQRILGFSLIELLITLSIAGILVAVIIASQGSLFEKTKQQTLSLQLLRAINLTRSEAIMRGVPITLCKSSDEKTCSGEWQDGYIILANDKILFSFHNKNLGILHWRAFPFNLQSLQFLPSGFPHAENGTFWYCDPQEKNPMWAVVINQSGRTRLEHPNKAGIILDDNGKRLEC